MLILRPPKIRNVVYSSVQPVLNLDPTHWTCRGASSEGNFLTIIYSLFMSKISEDIIDYEDFFNCNRDMLVSRVRIQ
jgi:hypothetical protein